MAKNFGPGILGSVVLIDPETGLPYKAAAAAAADLDATVAAQVSNPTSATGAALSATYALKPTGTPDGTKFYKDDGTWGNPSGSGAIGCWLSRTSTTPLTAASGSRAISFDTVSRADAGFTHTPASGEIVVPSDGWYLVSVSARFVSPSTGMVMLSVMTASGATFLLRSTQAQAVGTQDVGCSGAVYLAAGQAIQAYLYTGDSVQVTGAAGGAHTMFRAVRL